MKLGLLETMTLVMALLAHVQQALAEGKQDIEITEIGDKHKQAIQDALEALKNLN